MQVGVGETPPAGGTSCCGWCPTLVVQNDMRCFTNDILLQLEEKMMEEVEMEDKTREELKEEIVREKNCSFIGVLLNALTFGLVPKHVCLIM